MITIMFVCLVPIVYPYPISHCISPMTYSRMYVMYNNSKTFLFICILVLEIIIKFNKLSVQVISYTRGDLSAFMVIVVI